MSSSQIGGGLSTEDTIVSHHPAEVTGTIKFFKQAKGWGFVQVEGREDIFLHASALGEAYSQYDIIGGEPISGIVEMGDRGYIFTSVSSLTLEKNSDRSGSDSAKGKSNSKWPRLHAVGEIKATGSKGFAIAELESGEKVFIPPKVVGRLSPNPKAGDMVKLEYREKIRDEPSHVAKKAVFA